MDLQHSFRPIFVDYFKVNLFHRYKAVTYRRVLAEKGYDLQALQTIWNEKQKVIPILTNLYYSDCSILFLLLRFIRTGWSHRNRQQSGGY